MFLFIHLIDIDRLSKQNYPGGQVFYSDSRSVHFGIKLQFQVGISIQTPSSRLNYHMRALFIFLILIVVMNTVKCPGFSQTFDQGIA